MVVAPPSLTVEVSPHDPVLLNHVESVAYAAHRPVRPLHLQALLQLPRIADREGHVPISMVDRILAELVEELPVKAEWLIADVGSSPRLLQFHTINAETAYSITERFHYLRSPRTDGRAYALSTYTNRVVAMCVSSPLDVERLRTLLTLAGRRSGSARVLSRVFVFEGAPKNSISYMLSRAAEEERNLGATDLVTYVNPNMGFAGGSYLASGWHLLGTEPGTKYRYLNDRYITDRELAVKFGEHDDEGFRHVLGSRFAVSVMPLAPLLVFHRPL
jgi:hypothetical protein